MPQTVVAEDAFAIPKVVTPERTFLEKMFLLHEEFSKPQQEIRTRRMSRHLYDVVCMMKAGVDNKALDDAELYRSIVEHRRQFINLKGFDYDTLRPEAINIVPSEQVADLWKKDYEQMRLSMIYGDAPSFEEIMEQIGRLQQKVRALSQ